MNKKFKIWNLSLSKQGGVKVIVFLLVKEATKKVKINWMKLMKEVKVRYRKLVLFQLERNPWMIANFEKNWKIQSWMKYFRKQREFLRNVSHYKKSLKLKRLKLVVWRTVWIKLYSFWDWNQNMKTKIL